jgi:hypothetical protein
MGIFKNSFIITYFIIAHTTLYLAFDGVKMHSVFVIKVLCVLVSV